MRVVVAVHDPPIWTLPDTEIDRMRKTMPEADVVDARHPADRPLAFSEADVVVTTWMTEEEAALLDRARWIHSTAVGVGGLLRRGVVERGITVTNSRGVQAESVAEHALSLALALRRSLHVARDSQREGVWAQQALFDRAVKPLSFASLLVVGLGAIGSRIAANASGLGLRVVGMRGRPHLPAPAGVEKVIRPDQFREALSEADIVVLAAPHTAGTRALIGAAELAAMSESAVLINVARGALVDEPALVAALESGRIAGAGLDAFAHEPLAADSPLWRLPNVLITPHSASFQSNYWGPAVDLFLDNMWRFRRGDQLVNVVDPALGY